MSPPRAETFAGRNAGSSESQTHRDGYPRRGMPTRASTLVLALLAGAAAAATAGATGAVGPPSREHREPALSSASTRHAPGLGPRRAGRWVRPRFRCRGVKVRPGARTIQHAVDTHRARTTFCLRGGVYRLAGPIVPKTGDVFVGRPKTVVNGSKLLTGWRSVGRPARFLEGQGEHEGPGDAARPPLPH